MRDWILIAAAGAAAWYFLRGRDRLAVSDQSRLPVPPRFDAVTEPSPFAPGETVSVPRPPAIPGGGETEGDGTIPTTPSYYDARLAVPYTTTRSIL